MEIIEEMSNNKSNLKIIAEIASNWNGNESVGKKIIKNAKVAGADYVKFQMWRANELYSKSHPNWKEILHSELKPLQIKHFKKYSESIGIGCICSVFYPEAVDILEELDVPFYKIASRTSALMDANSLNTMIRVAQTKKPVIISMGFGGNVEAITKIFQNNKKYFLYCISKYPTRIDEVNFKLMKKFDGFSDHTEGALAPIMYALQTKNSKKTRFLEKHVCINESRGPDRPFSMEITEFANMVTDIRNIPLIQL